jgi:hypothetical protein
MWCWRRVERISSIDYEKNEVRRVKEERNIVPTIRRKKSKWLGHKLCRKCLLKHVTAGKIEVTGRRRR